VGKHCIAEAGNWKQKLKKKEERNCRGIRAKPMGELAVARSAAQEILPATGI
jgi:hypothetical protein